ncbi:MAG TPA: extracellular solute-binding protein [Petrotogaceae bacterium]|mgnify:FL=1|nr:extracellular solute-binding protein [Petrotogaceae bacterium]HQF33096.1 extracellular solute-binding protein [Petrotogaceae bacterium]HQI77958.1 extracellular solute-binding protein [Petrotogaceae bacterium]
MKKYLFILTAIIISSVLHARQIEVWHIYSGCKKEFLQKTSTFYEENTEQSTIKLIGFPDYASMITALNLSMKNNIPPNILICPDILSKILIDSGSVLAVQKLIDIDTDFKQKNLLQLLLEKFRYKQNIYALPFNPVILMSFYNTSLSDRLGLDGKSIPRTLEEVLQNAMNASASELYSREDISYVSMPLDSIMLENFLCMSNLFFTDQDNGRSEEPDSIMPDISQIYSFIDFWINMQNLKYAKLYAHDGWQESMDSFISGKSCMTFSWSDNIKKILDQSEKRNFKTDIGFVPVFKRMEGSPLISCEGLWLVSGHNQDEIKEAWNFLKYLVSEKVQADCFLSCGSIPVSTLSIDYLLENDFSSQTFASYMPLIKLLVSNTSFQSTGAFFADHIYARKTINDFLKKSLSLEMDSQEVSLEERLLKVKRDIDSHISFYNDLNSYTK